MTAVYLRYCPDCGEEYQPHMTECVECGGVLKEKLEGDLPEPEPSEVAAANLPPGDYRRIVAGLPASTVARLLGRFMAASIPIKVESVGHHLTLSARVEDVPAALAVLERQGVVPKQPDVAEPPVGTEGGRCPACGTSAPPGTHECPECGLLFAGGLVCDSCGEELSPDDSACPGCGQRQDG